MNIDFLSACRAIESLRSGVPNSIAVALLGCSQPRIVKRFETAIDGLLSTRSQSGHDRGFLVKGGFGCGKSHLLARLTEIASKRECVISRVPINKETPLSDPDKLFKALAQSAVLPDRRGPGLYEAAQKIDTESNEFRELEKWARTDNSLDERFHLSLQMFRMARRNFEIKDQIARFWAGETFGIPLFKSRLQEVGMPVSTKLRTVKTQELARQRMAFATRMLAASGYSRWVWLIDEVELIGCYSSLQRLKSYCEIGRMLSGKVESDRPGVVTVMAITDDFETAVLFGKGDLFSMPSHFEERRTMEADDARYPPQYGMSIIQKEGILLEPLRTEDADALYRRLQQLYSAAYDWEPRETQIPTVPSSTTVRQRIKQWITTWDMERLFPDVQTVMQLDAVANDYTEETPDVQESGMCGDAIVDEILKSLDC